jgi:hypothetical protein
MRLDDLGRGELAALVPEYLLAGHLIDRAGMPHLISAFGRDVMRDIAIDEWMGASPVYTRRMQRALRFEGDTVETIFKGMQIDVGAPPQFMDFRYRLTTPYAGEFWLDHCGALMDVEPMGDDYVVAMCHDIEDPTFDATAIATNARAQVRPIHRPPRTPVGRQPHCHWTVTVDDAHPELPIPQAAFAIGATRAANVELAAIDLADEGAADYSGPLMADLRFEDWSRSALRRIAEEVCLQGHLLNLSFRRAVRERAADEAQAIAIGRHQFCGIAGLAAERIRAAFDLGSDLDGLAAVLALHPALLPAAYVDARVDMGADAVTLTIGGDSDAMADGAWPSLLAPEALGPIDAIAHAVDPHYRCTTASIAGGELVVEIRAGVDELPESADVALTRFSTGADFAFADRPTKFEIRPSRA